MKPMTFAQSGLSGSMKFSGQETGHFVARGTRLTGKYHPENFAATSEVNGVKFSIPLRKFTNGSSAVGWESFSCSGNKLTMINPPPASSWTFTRIG